MLAMAITLVLCSALFIGLTHPLELRRWRLSKIAISLLLVGVIVAIIRHGLGRAMFGGIIIFVSLCYLWKGNLAYFVTHGVMNLLYGEWDQGSSGGFRPDYRGVHLKIEEGNLAEAIEQTKRELEKSSRDYEGRMLLASLYQELNRPEEALPHLEAILQNPEATDAQKQKANMAKAECYQLKHYLEITRRH